ncbi:MAG TPA: SAM-dependent DNA methyltransferase, partial [Leucothrix mucor]|nr:SAM-dependent DNA methyltransferase [Leucothrix mucor]
TMQLSDLQAFIDCYNPENRHDRSETWSEKKAKNTDPDGRWRKFSYEEIITRDKTNLDIFWLKDKSLTDLDNLPEPDVLAAEIIKNIESGLASFKGIVEGLEVD